MDSVLHTALWIFVFAIPLENVVHVPGLGSVSRGLGVLTFVASVLRMVMHGRVRRPGAFAFCIALFLLWSTITAFWTFEPADTLVRVKTYAQLAIMAWVFWEFAETPEQHASMLRAYVLGASCVAASTIWSYASGARVIDERYTTAGFNANDLGTELTLAIPMAWYLGLTARTVLRRWIYWLYLPFGMLAVVLTASRGAIIAAVVALTVVPLTSTAVRLRTKVLLAAFVVACAVTLAEVAPDASWERLATTRSEVHSGDLDHRGTIWKAGLNIFMDHPVVGVGAGAFSQAAAEQLGRPFAAHSAFVAVLVEQGAVGLMLFLTLFLVAFRPWAGFERLDARYRLVLLGTLLIGIVPLSWDYAKVTWFVLAMLASQPGMRRLRSTGHAELDVVRHRDEHRHPFPPLSPPLPETSPFARRGRL